jgi:hypothetical protein
MRPGKAGLKGKRIRKLLKFGNSVQRVRNPPDQSAVPQVGSEPCDGVGNHDGDA